MFVFLAIAESSAFDDPTLARRIKQGDPVAFKSFFERHHGVLYGYLRRRGLAGAVCEDLIQNAFLKIWERRDEIDEKKSLRAFLFKICYTRALNHFRDTARFVDATEMNEPVTSTAPDRDTDYALTQQALQKAIAGLPERRRAVFELCFVEEHTYRETAEILGLSVKTIENQMGHALKAIRSAMQHYLRDMPPPQPQKSAPDRGGYSGHV